MKLKRHITIPLALLIYFCLMAYIGRDIILKDSNYLLYFGSIALELAVIIALYFLLKKRDRLRNERLREMENQDK